MPRAWRSSLIFSNAWIMRKRNSTRYTKCMHRCHTLPTTKTAGQTPSTVQVRTILDCTPSRRTTIRPDNEVGWDDPVMLPPRPPE
jgi:hypothetical protein